MWSTSAHACFNETQSHGRYFVQHPTLLYSPLRGEYFFTHYSVKVTNIIHTFQQRFWGPFYTILIVFHTMKYVCIPRLSTQIFYKKKNYNNDPLNVCWNIWIKFVNFTENEQKNVNKCIIKICRGPMSKCLSSS